MLIWGTQVTFTQFFGYSIALSGLVYYKVGAEQLKQVASQGVFAWSEFGAQRPALRKLLVFGLALITIFVLLGGLAPTYAPTQTQTVKNLFGGKGSTGS